MGTLYNQDLREIIEYKEASERLKQEKKAFRVTIASILGILVIGGGAIFANKHKEKVEARNNEPPIETEKDYIDVEELPGVGVMPEAVTLDKKEVKDSLYLQFNSSFLDPEYQQDVMVLRSKNDDAYKLTMLYDKEESGWEYLGLLNDEISEDIIRFYHLSRVVKNKELHVYAVCEPENSHLTRTHTTLICNEEVSKNTNLYEGYVLNDLGLLSDFIMNKKIEDKELSDMNSNYIEEGVSHGK